MDATKVAEFMGLNRLTINRVFDKIRIRIADICEAASPFENDEIELDESYFGARRVRGKRGRGAQGEIPVFGMLKRGDNGYTQIVKNVQIRSRTNTICFAIEQFNRNCDSRLQ